MTLLEIVLKLTGQIRPVGETNEDNRRYENLEELLDLTNELLKEIDSVAYNYRNDSRYSIKRAAERCSKFFKGRSPDE